MALQSCTNLLFLFLAALFLSVGGQGPLYNAVDFTKEHEFTSGIEGPAVDRYGILYAVNFQSEGTIGRVQEDGKPELFVTLPEGSLGNGIRFLRDGTMLVADYKGHNLLAVDMKSRSVSVWMHEPKMHQPNDLTITSDGTVFMSDPDWPHESGQLWCVHQGERPKLIEGGMGTTNGVEVSPDDRFLYVNESIQRKIWRYDLTGRREVSNKKLLIEFPDYGLDGMRCDALGNLYVARYGKGTVVKLSPDGKLLQEIMLKGKLPSNLTFGGKDGKTVFVTLQDRGSIEMFRVD